MIMFLLQILEDLRLVNYLCCKASNDFTLNCKQNK